MLESLELASYHDYICPFCGNEMTYKYLYFNSECNEHQTDDKQSKIKCPKCDNNIVVRVLMSVCLETTAHSDCDQMIANAKLKEGEVK